jgi:hypothetical protein
LQKENRGYNLLPLFRHGFAWKALFPKETFSPISFTSVLEAEIQNLRLTGFSSLTCLPNQNPGLP